MTLTLDQLLSAKEARQQRQRFLREKFHTVIASITINIPGHCKDSATIRHLCDFAVSALQSSLPVLAVERINLPTGPEALVAIPFNADESKAVAVILEESYPFGRLLDIDVFDIDGTQLSRQTSGTSRSCLLCDQPAIVCMRERNHRVEEIKSAVDGLLNQFLAFQARQISPKAEKLASLALEAMLYEVACTPSPGLVDRVNSGAHTDMDFFSFMSSSAALSISLARCCEAGIRHKGPHHELLSVLRIIGLDGEKSMLQATKGVNTQKGLLFSLGIIVAAAGCLFTNGQTLTPRSVLTVTAQIVNGIVAQELDRPFEQCNRKLTAGERLFRDQGIRGIRGEMEDGLPAVYYQALPALQEALHHGLSINDALVQTLLVLMTTVEDTTIMNRHSKEKLEHWVRPLVDEFLRQGGMYTSTGREKAAEMDKLFIEHNVSPGGAADLLAVTWFLHRLTD